jgi:hypothetical protein
LAGPIVLEFNETLKKYPNLPTKPAGAALGAELPHFVLPVFAPTAEKK